MIITSYLMGTIAGQSTVSTHVSTAAIVVIGSHYSVSGSLQRTHQQPEAGDDRSHRKRRADSYPDTGIPQSVRSIESRSPWLPPTKISPFNNYYMQIYSHQCRLSKSATALTNSPNSNQFVSHAWLPAMLSSPRHNCYEPSIIWHVRRFKIFLCLWSVIYWFCEWYHPTLIDNVIIALITGPAWRPLNIQSLLNLSHILIAKWAYCWSSYLQSICVSADLVAYVPPTSALSAIICSSQDHSICSRVSTSSTLTAWSARWVIHCRQHSSVIMSMRSTGGSHISPVFYDLCEFIQVLPTLMPNMKSKVEDLQRRVAAKDDAYSVVSSSSQNLALVSPKVRPTMSNPVTCLFTPPNKGTASFCLILTLCHLIIKKFSFESVIAS